MPAPARADRLWHIAGLVAAAAVLFVIVAGLRFDRPPASQPIASASSASPDPSKVDPRPSTPPVLLDLPARLRWIIEGGTIYLQEDGTTRAVTEVRVLEPDGRVNASGVVRPAQPGEPRTCGHPDLVPPLIASMALAPEAAADFASGTPQRYRLEARREGVWGPVTPLNWLQLAREGICR